MSVFVQAIITASQAACELKSNVADWSKHRKYGHQRRYHEDDFDAYKRFNDTLWGCTFKNLLGREVCKDRMIRILDVGCGKKSTYYNIVHGNQETDCFTYTSIDMSPQMKPDILCDVFAEKEQLITKLKNKQFDMLILDIEPHGREIELFDMFREFLAKEYIIVFKCIAVIDLYGSMMAHWVLEHMLNQGCLVDYFAVEHINTLTRDVFAVGRTKDVSPPSLDETQGYMFKGDIYYSMKKMGGKGGTYFTGKEMTKIESLVLMPGTPTFLSEIEENGIIVRVV